MTSKGRRCYRIKIYPSRPDRAVDARSRTTGESHRQPGAPTSPATRGPLRLAGPDPGSRPLQGEEEPRGPVRPARLPTFKTVIPYREPLPRRQGTRRGGFTGARG